MCPEQIGARVEWEGKRTTSRSVLPQAVMDRISSALSALFSCSSRHSALPRIPCYTYDVSYTIMLLQRHERVRCCRKGPAR